MAVMSCLRLYVPLGTKRKGEGEGDVLLTFCRRRGGLMVSPLDSGSKGPGSSAGRVIVLCSWATQFTLTVPLSTQEYIWVPARNAGGYLRWTSIPSRRSSNTPSHLMLRKPG